MNPHEFDHPPVPPTHGAPLLRVATAARELAATATPEEVLHRALHLAVEIIAGAEDASVTVRHRGAAIETPAATSDLGAEVDRLQYDAGVGPCLSALDEREIVAVGDLAADERLGDWGRRTSEKTGVHSMLCFRLFTNKSLVGALNLFARRSHAFTSDDIELGQAFAAQVAAAFVKTSTITNLEAGLDARSRIGEAAGILMERYDISSSRAFEVLTRYSQDSNRKLRDIAAELVETRRLPGHEGPRQRPD